MCKPQGIAGVLSLDMPDYLRYLYSITSLVPSFIPFAVVLCLYPQLNPLLKGESGSGTFSFYCYFSQSCDFKGYNIHLYSWQGPVVTPLTEHKNI